MHRLGTSIWPDAQPPHLAPIKVSTWSNISLRARTTFLLSTPTCSPMARNQARIHGLLRKSLIGELLDTQFYLFSGRSKREGNVNKLQALFANREALTTGSVDFFICKPFHISVTHSQDQGAFSTFRNKISRIQRLLCLRWRDFSRWLRLCVW
jgi:hypothetical protein